MRLAPFTRLTDSTQYVREIDGLRFVAIVWVMLFHVHVYTWSKLGLPGPPETATLSVTDIW